ncbi:MAG: hypothetical protein CSB24_02835 [Deltaproteobacteria bacterium]|nr:MAG: hypothetical protein CSB24_02835 [Deltaproteobacteria bacterium]
MIDLIKKTMFTGMGFASLTKDKAEEVAQKFIDKGKMSELEGKRLVDELMAKSAKSREDMQKQIEDAVDVGLKKLNMARSDEIDDLRAEIAELRKQLAEKN